MTKAQENKLRKEYKDAVKEYEAMEENLDMPETELMYSEGEMNALARVLKIMEIKP